MPFRRAQGLLGRHILLLAVLRERIFPLGTYFSCGIGRWILGERHPPTGRGLSDLATNSRKRRRLPTKLRAVNLRQPPGKGSNVEIAIVNLPYI